MANLKAQKRKPSNREEEEEEEIELTGIKVQQSSSKSFGNGFVNYGQYHHVPPSSEAVFTPKNLDKFNLRLEKAKQKSEEIATPTSGYIKRQVAFWAEHDTHTSAHINSVKIDLFLKKPHINFKWNFLSHGPLIGIYKQTGTTKGQVVYASLPETSALVKLLMKVLQCKEKQLRKGESGWKALKKQNPVGVNLTQTSKYQPVCWLDFGMEKDYVYTTSKPAPEVDYKETLQALERQIKGRSRMSDFVYPIGSIKLLDFTVQRQIFQTGDGIFGEKFRICKKEASCEKSKICCNE